jgi:hypothetical protein
MAKGKKLEYEASKDVLKQTQTRLENLDIQIVNVRLKIEEVLDVLHKHEQAIANKKEQYDEYERLKIDNPLFAHAFAVRKKLNITLKRKQDRENDLEDLEQKLNDLTEERKQLSVDSEKGIPAFDPFQKQLDNPSLKKDFYFAGGTYWNQRNSRFKTYQDVFTPHRAYASYRIRSARDGKYYNDHEDRIPLSNCIVDPSRFTEKFLSEFGLADLSDCLTPLQKITAKTEAIPEVAGFFEHLQPASELKGGKLHHNYRFYVLEGLDPAHNGKMISAKYTGTLPEGEDYKTLTTFQDIYSARRSAEHTANNLDDKGVRILEIEAFVRQVHQDVLKIRANDPKKEGKKEEARRKLEEAFNRLKRATSFRGKKAAIKIESVADLKDSSGKDNPSVVCTKLLGAITEIKERYPQVVDKRKYSVEDSTLLSRQILAHEGDLDLYFTGFNKVCEKLVSAQSSVVFKDVPEERVGNQRKYTTNAILKPLDDLPDLGNLTVRPFNLYAAKLQEKRKSIEEGVYERDIKKTREEAVKAFVISKIFQIQKKFESVLREVSVEKSTDWKGLQEKMKSILGIADKREVFPDVEVNSYKDIYAGLIGQMQDVIDLLEGFLKSSDEKSNETLKKNLEEIDFPATLSKLN